MVGGCVWKGLIGKVCERRSALADGEGVGIERLPVWAAATRLGASRRGGVEGEPGQSVAAGSPSSSRYVSSASPPSPPASPGPEAALGNYRDAETQT